MLLTPCCSLYVQKHFSGDDTLTTCNLINRMTSTILHHKYPFSLLYLDHHPFPLVLPSFMSLILVRINYLLRL